MPLLTDVECRGISRLVPEFFSNRLTLHLYGAAGRPTVVSLHFEDAGLTRRLYEAMSRAIPTPPPTDVAAYSAQRKAFEAGGTGE